MKKLSASVSSVRLYVVLDGNKWGMIGNLDFSYFHLWIVTYASLNTTRTMATSATRGGADRKKIKTKEINLKKCQR